MEADARCADRLDVTYQAAARLLGRTPQQVAFGAVPRVRLFDLGKEKPACVNFTLDDWSCSAVKQNWPTGAPQSRPTVELIPLTMWKCGE
jgi:hypothetical protein